MGVIVVLGRIPSKKNSRVNTRSGRSFPSPAYTQWHQDASYQLLGKKPIKTDYMELHFYFPDNRKSDLTNKAESIMDCLVDNGIIADDSWHVINHLRLISHGVDKENPRCEIIW